MDVFQGSDRVARVNVRSRDVALDIGSEFTRFGELRFGIMGGSLDTTQQTGPPGLVQPSGRVTQGGYTTRLVFDQLDSANFPRSGYAGRIEGFRSTSALGADASYTRVEGDLIVAASTGPHTVQFSAKGGAPVGSDPIPPYDQFVWGGFLQQSGYPRGALTGQRLAFGRAVYYYKLATQRFFEGAYAGFSLEAGYLGKPLVPGGVEGYLKSAAAFVAIDTPVGPVYLGYGRASGGSSAAYFYLGRP
jgi:NTE family protein